MKKKIKIAQTITKVETIEREIEFPETNKYYRSYDDSRFFGEGEILFAILQTFPKSEPPTNYTLVRITSNKQDYTDFVPTKDCRSEYWKTDSNNIRREALKIIETEFGWDEITKEEFEEKRMILLNRYKDYE